MDIVIWRLGRPSLRYLESEMNKLLAFGDSHLEALKFAWDLKLLQADDAIFCIVPGATAVGLRNPNSVTNALEIFQAAAEEHRDATHALIHLGEVDCGFVVWWRCMKFGESVERQIDCSIDAYGKFVADLYRRGFSRVCITGASLPTIRDHLEFGEVANRRREVTVGLAERTALTLSYNERLHNLARETGSKYFDLSSGTINRDDKIVSDHFRNEDPRDHHLDVGRTVGLWAYACNQFLSSVGT